MKRFVSIEYWYYIDENPRTHVDVFEGKDMEEIEKTVNEAVESMKRMWCEGTTRLVGILTQSEAKAWVEEKIAKEKSNWQEDSQEYINNLTNLYKKCYEEE